jgi:hypothetical protein
MNAALAACCLVASCLLGQGARDAPADEAPPTAGSRAAEEISRLAEQMRSAPAFSVGEQADRAAQVARGVIRPLPVSVAIATTVVGFAMLLFGQRMLRFGIVIYLAVLCGLTGREIGASAGEGWHALVGGAAGCVVGAGIALPLRALARSVVGGLAGGVLAAMVMQAFTSSTLVTLLAAGGGIVLSAVLSLYFPTPLMIIGFAMFGAATASIGILSIAVEPLDGRIPYAASHITGMVLAAALGVLFQSQLGKADANDGSE